VLEPLFPPGECDRLRHSRSAQSVVSLKELMQSGLSFALHKNRLVIQQA